MKSSSTDPKPRYGVPFKLRPSKLRGLATSVIACCCVAGCASLRGNPDDLTAAQYQSFSATDLSKNLTVAQDLAQRWKGDRNDTYDWVFWSNASLIPLAAGGAGAALYKGSRDLVTGIGLTAGTLIGTNTFIGAADIGAVYQSGIIGLNCVYSKLNPYADTDKANAAAKLAASATSLESLIAAGNQALQASTGLDMTSAAATAERTANPTVVTTLSNNEKVLSQTLANAQTAVTNAQSEVHLFATLPAYARDRIIDVDNLVGMRIKPKTVNYATLSASLSTPAAPAKPAPVSGTTQSPAPPGAPAPGARLPPGVAPPPPPTPIADAAKATKNASDNLVKPTQDLATATSTFDLSTQENNVASCIKSL